MGRRPKLYPGNHLLVRGSVDGWYVCACGCGYVAVCRHCLSSVPRGVPETWCDAEARRLKIGPYAPKEDGRAV